MLGIFRGLSGLAERIDATFYGEAPILNPLNQKSWLEEKPSANVDVPRRRSNDKLRDRCSTAREGASIFVHVVGDDV